MEQFELKKLEKLNKRYRKQNEEIAKKYDRISATLPKGTIDRIKALGITINAAINQSLLTYLECMEEDMAEYRDRAEPDNDKTPQKPPIPAAEENPSLVQEPQKPPRTVEEEAAELQALIDAKKAEQKRAEEEREQEKKRRKEEEIRELQEGIHRIYEQRKEAHDAEIAEDERRFKQLEEDKIMSLLQDEGFRKCAANPVYKKDFVNNYGLSNYEMLQKCIKQIEEAEKESRREETIASAGND